MKVGYARTSTLDQVAGFDAQIKELNELGCEKIFKEQVSSVAKRDQLEMALEFVREGDSFCVTKLDRLARSTQHLLEITSHLDGKHVALNIIDLGVDTSTATGKLLLTMIGAIGQFEREMMLERQREGIARAKAEGKYKGRKPTARAKKDDIVKLKSEGVGATQIAKTLGIGRASVYRILNSNQQPVTGGQTK
jgi:DNA invertase Pin-like site-specific DNA recombinase